MKIEAVSVNDYFDKVPEERKLAMDKLRTSINSNLPDGYEERFGYGMPSWVVPHSIYPAGYHANTKLPLPFMSIASQKNFIGLYHMGIYADVKLLKWWEKEYAQYCTKKIDMGKSCIRLKHLDDIPYDLIAKLCTKISVDEWVKIYEENIKR